MPLYEYVCEDCDRRFERLAPSREADESKCPYCHTSRTRRLLSVVAGLGRHQQTTAQGCACGGACSCN
jgi:putative FmdB family regulatory protein